ncbi:unnamed protein product [Spirodela intermedia]|uniref:SHSP domain-containing protein n=1 Tax=Spirodela intermedia TaxID=51605 RepID=A0A7I8IP72_SPIIN|nr:unnamed protein product [Spirodela intermedia]CAA6659384.1 unnamed protein product [Spirodela intermedia]
MAEEFFGGPLRRLFWGPLPCSMDWIETPSAHIFKINAPGFGREEVKVQLEEGSVIHVRGEAKEEPISKEAIWRLAERGKGDFSRRFPLPEDAKPDQIRAQVENGVLTVVVPREVAPPRPKSRSITVSSKL